MIEMLLKILKGISYAIIIFIITVILCCIIAALIVSAFNLVIGLLIADYISISALINFLIIGAIWVLITLFIMLCNIILGR